MEDYARDNKLNVIVDATLKVKVARPAHREQGGGLQDFGHYMYASPAEAAKRALGRFVDGNKENGQGPVLCRRNTAGPLDNEHNFDAHRKDMDYWEVYDNMGSSPKLHSKKGAELFFLSCSFWLCTT
jgi:hypothetical protein